MGQVLGVTIPILNREGRRNRMRIYVCVPFYRQMGETARIVHGEIAGQRYSDDFHIIWVENPASAIHVSRNELVETVMAIETERKLPADYILFLDDDMGYPKEFMLERNPAGVSRIILMIEALCRHNVDIVGPVMVGRKPPYPPMVFRYKDGLKGLRRVWELPAVRDGKLERVDAIGTGMMAIKRSVFDKFKADFETRVEMLRRYEKWYEKQALEEFPEDLRNYLAISQAQCFPYFQPNFLNTENPDRRWEYVGEDVAFCIRAAKLGCFIWCDFGMTIGHQSDIYAAAEHYRTQFMEREVSENLKAEIIERQKLAESNGHGESAVVSESNRQPSTV